MKQKIEGGKTEVARESRTDNLLRRLRKLEKLERLPKNGWRNLRPIHIVPNNDIIPHTTIGGNCWCRPRFEDIGEGLYVHNSGDKRELLENQQKQND